MVDVKCLSDCELQEELRNLGFAPGPILPSTRKVYEKKLLKLLSPTPCDLPEKNDLGELDESQESDASEECNTTICLKGNTSPSTEKSKRPTKNSGFEIQEQQKEIRKPECGFSDSKMMGKHECVKSLARASSTSHIAHHSSQHQRPEVATAKGEVPDCSRVDFETSRETRCIARSPTTNGQHKSTAKEKDGLKSQNPDGLPLAIMFAVLSIFIVMVFIYITMERKTPSS